MRGGCDVGQGRQIGKQVEILKHHADVGTHVPQVLTTGRDQVLAARGMPQRFTVKRHVAAVDAFQRHHDVQQGRLARATGTDNCNLVAAFQR